MTIEVINQQAASQQHFAQLLNWFLKYCKNALLFKKMSLFVINDCVFYYFIFIIHYQPASYL